MRRILFTIIALVPFLSVSAQTRGKQDLLTMREAIAIASFWRDHPLADTIEYKNFVKPILSKYGYREEGFLTEVGTCCFEEYIKGGHIVEYTEPGDLFVPDNPSVAGTFVVTDCRGIDGLEDDETDISAEIRVFTEKRRDEILNEMKQMGFTINHTGNGYYHYAWKSYKVFIWDNVCRGHRYWEFSIELQHRDYGSTRHFEFADSARTHDIEISVDYPVSGSPALLRQTRTFIMEALELDLQTEGPAMGRFNGDPSDGRAVVNYYGVNGVPLLKERCAASEWNSMSECTQIKKVAENDYYISFEVEKFCYYNPYTPDVMVYGATFRKSDGKRLRVMARTGDAPLQKLLRQSVPYDDEEFIRQEYADRLPMPLMEPYLLQTTVRFVYQYREVTVRDAPYITSDVPFYDIKQYLTDEVKNVLK